MIGDGLWEPKPHPRKVTWNLSINFEEPTYQMAGHGKGYRLRGAAVTVCKGFDGGVTVLREGRELPVRLLGDGKAPGRRERPVVARRGERTPDPDALHGAGCKGYLANRALQTAGLPSGP